MFQLQRAFRIATALVVSQTIAIFLTTTPITAAETALKPAAEDETSDTAITPTKKIDPGAVKFWQALTLLEQKDPKEPAKGREALQAAADLEYTHAQTLLAECLMTGQNGFPKDERKAANLYRLAAERGNAFAQVSLGQCLFFGTGISRNRKRAAEWLTAALDEKADYSRPTPPDDYLAEATKNLAKNTIVGGLDRDPVSDCQASAHYLLGGIAFFDNKPDLAQKHFVQAATAGIDGRSGIYPAAVQAALNYAFGQGTPRDITKANQMLEISRKLIVRTGVRMIHNYANLGLIDDLITEEIEDKISSQSDLFRFDVQFSIANSFTDKKSKDYNPSEAVKWFELAAENGNAWAMLNLAFLYSGDELGKPDPTQAFLWFEKLGGGDKPKHGLGTSNLAICLFNGFGTPKDTARAEELFKRHKNSDFVCYLGSIGKCPTTILTNAQRIKLIETWAKDRKDAHAAYFMGLRYKYGWDVPHDSQETFSWFKKAAQGGLDIAWTELGHCYEYRYDVPGRSMKKSWELALECYQKAVAADDPKAMVSLAELLITDSGITPAGSELKFRHDSSPSLIKLYKPGADYLTEAKALYLRCVQIDPKHAKAHERLGDIYRDELVYNNPPLTKSEFAEASRQMLVHYETASQLGNTSSTLNLGNIYWEGKTIPQDYRKAYYYFNQAADNSPVHCHYMLGLMHELGNGVPVTYNEAAYHYRIAALGNASIAIDRLANLYSSGLLGTIDLDKALFWLERLSTFGGDANAWANFADTLIRTKNYPAAIKLLNKLSQWSSEPMRGFAYDRLSTCYAEGLGVVRSQKKAMEFQKRALACGNGDALFVIAQKHFEEGNFKEAIAVFTKASATSASACFALGQLYYSGEQIPRDNAKAIQYIRKAADNNHTEALYFLAAFTYNRVPGAPGIDEAIRLAQQAEAAGHPQAAVLRQKLEKRRDTGNDAPAEETARARSS